MGGWTASSFSVDQQGKYGVNDEGEVHEWRGAPNLETYYASFCPSTED